MGRRKAFKPDERLTQAMLHFWRVGYWAATIDELMNCMGIGRQSLYDTFGEKERLFELSFRHYERDFLARELDALTFPANPLDGLRNLMTRWMRATGDTSTPAGCFLTCSLVELHGTAPRLHEIAVDIDDKLVARAAHRIREASESGLAHPSTDAGQVAQHLLTCRHGLMVRHRAGSGTAVPFGGMSLIDAILGIDHAG